MEEDKTLIKNKISLVKPQFSLSIETDERLEKAKKVFEELIEKYKKR